MPFSLIKGRFAPQAGRPDGDSLRFVPADPAPLFRLRRQGVGPRINQNNGSIQLRYEGIDTMEGAAAPEFADAATASNLELAGTNGGERDAPGYILTNQIGPNGRPIAFVFAGNTDEEDGASLFVEPGRILNSINVEQLRRGLAYPLFYDTLFDDLRRKMREISLLARAEGAGLWPADRTQIGATWTGSLNSLAPIFPKLWRRLQEFQRDETLFDPAQPLVNFREWVEAEKPERVVIPGQDCITGFDNLITVEGQTLGLSIDPHDMVIVS